MIWSHQDAIALATRTLVSCRLILQFSRDPAERAQAHERLALAQRVMDAAAAQQTTVSALTATTR